MRTLYSFNNFHIQHTAMLIIFIMLYVTSLGFPCYSAVKNPPANAGDVGLIPGLGRSPGEGNGNPLQHSCLGNPMDRGVWHGLQSMGSHRVGRDLVTEQACTHTHCITSIYLITESLYFLSAFIQLPSPQPSPHLW